MTTQTGWSRPPDGPHIGGITPFHAFNTIAHYTLIVLFSPWMRGYRYRAAYSASKWGVRGLTRTAAIEVGEHNVNVNAIMPGIVETEST